MTAFAILAMFFKIRQPLVKQTCRCVQGGEGRSASLGSRTRRSSTRRWPGEKIRKGRRSRGRKKMDMVKKNKREER